MKKACIFLMLLLFTFSCSVEPYDAENPGMSIPVTETVGAGYYPNKKGIIFYGQTPARGETQVTYNPNSDQIYFIGEDSNVHGLWWDTQRNAWGDANITQNAPKVHNTRYGLAFRNNKVFYAASNKKLVYLYWNGSWKYSYVPDSEYPGSTIVDYKSKFSPAGSDSIYYFEGNSIFHGIFRTNGSSPSASGRDIAPNYPRGFGVTDFLVLSFVNQDNKVYHKYYRTEWQCTVLPEPMAPLCLPVSVPVVEPIVANAPRVMARTNIVTSASSNQLYYIAENGYIHALWKNSSGEWRADWICSSIKAKGNSELLYADNKLFFVDVNNDLRYLFYYNSNWNCSGELYTNIKSGTGLAYGNNKVFFVDGDGKIWYYDFSK